MAAAAAPSAADRGAALRQSPFRRRSWPCRQRNELRRQAEALGAYVMRPGIAREFGCALPGDADLMGDRVEPAEVCSIRSLRRIGPDKSVAFDLVAEIVQRRWLSVPGQPPVEFLGGATAIIGADGRFRYVISKSVTDSRRAAEHIKQARAGGSYEERGGRLWLRQASLRALHRQPAAAETARPQESRRTRRQEECTMSGSEHELRRRSPRSPASPSGHRAPRAKISAPTGGARNRDAGNRPDIGCVPRQLPERLQVKAAQTATRINPANGVNIAAMASLGLSRNGIMDPQRIAILTSQVLGPAGAPAHGQLYGKHAGRLARTDRQPLERLEPDWRHLLCRNAGNRPGADLPRRRRLLVLSRHRHPAHPAEPADHEP